MSVSQPLVQIALLGEAIDRAPIAVLIADDSGAYVAANRYACEMLGYPREELVRLRVQDVSADPDVEAHSMAVRARPDGAVVTLRRKDGSTLGFRYRGGETTVAGLAYYFSIGVPVE